MMIETISIKLYRTSMRPAFFKGRETIRVNGHPKIINTPIFKRIFNSSKIGDEKIVLFIEFNLLPPKTYLHRSIKYYSSLVDKSGPIFEGVNFDDNNRELSPPI
jgi:hypothetical protein